MNSTMFVPSIRSLVGLILLFMNHACASDPEVSQDARSPSRSFFTVVWNNRLYLYSAAAVVLGIWFSLEMALRKQSLAGRSSLMVNSAVKKNHERSLKENEVHVGGVKIFYGSQTGTAKGFAKDLSEEVKALGISAEVIDMKDYDPDDQLADECANKSVCVFLLATYTDGQPTENAEWFCKWLEEASTDFRYGKTYLKGLRYAVFGLGNSAYVGHYNTVSKNVDKWLWMLSGMRILTRGEGDCNVVKSRHGSIQADFAAWQVKFLNRMLALAKGEKKSCSGSGICQKNARTSCKNNEDVQNEEKTPLQNNNSEDELLESSSDEESNLPDGEKSHSVVDVEDLGSIMNTVKNVKIIDGRGDGQMILSKLNGVKKLEDEAERRDMITPALREALTKQGYRLIVSHSGVKLCRWTRTLENHQNMIWQFRGVPGVKPERFEEGLAVRHCALSLVGEPIMYPEINTFIRLLHSHRISTFLVTNAQFPDEIRSLVPVTQLYVSVDASTKESLKRIDRPLFRDFWPRFLDSLKALGEKRQRTVYRLTLVKAWNVEELQSYSELIALGQPDFVEVKTTGYQNPRRSSTKHGSTYGGEPGAHPATDAVERKMEGRKPQILWPKSSQKKEWETINIDIVHLLEGLKGGVEKKLVKIGEIIYSYGAERFGVKSERIRSAGTSSCQVQEAKRD
ncbi:LOW QUALITY PROTEIN: S-adenosyl-L-methionine-dependent tRNA 4-demethylwyosine synthase TYW1-like [Thalassophryne amazonica]|uniref:LOW QUALITY PROTEIN: S-adenosyl-L-methionine-dependent tRNA 4-demethylwyosine synthase TYW1-like n=1 Tax=Thalassophryne amazonica TaxID=390379 RepID=UPI001471CC02|nr:LOW QUALITY PROTEIN: S-adenosyl-L-methionine-dependent tRNA 4-demethylwyosine synthase TYW1-like [Thalassophryne amazonica]